MRCCPWMGSVETLLNTVPCPPPMMNFSDFRTFVLDQNITQSEFSTIASKCNVFDTDATTSHTSITATTAVDRNVTSHINSTTTAFVVTSHTKEVTTAGYPEIGSDMRIVIGVTCGSLALILIFVILLIKILLQNARRTKEMRRRTTDVSVSVLDTVHLDPNDTKGNKGSSEEYTWAYDNIIQPDSLNNNYSESTFYNHATQQGETFVTRL